MRHLLKDDFYKYSVNIKGARDVVPKIIECFDKYKVESTWALVGGLMLRDWKEFKDVVSDVDIGFIPFSGEMRKEFEDLYFAPDLVQLLKKTHGVEIASHTFSHLFPLEPAVTPDHFENDTRLFTIYVGRN